MANQSESTAVSHTNAVKDVIQAARQSYQSLLYLQSYEDVNPDGVFIPDAPRGENEHPQKAAHSHILGYHYQLAKKTLWIQAKDLWQEPIKDGTGSVYEVTVPDGTEFTVSLDDSHHLSLDDIPTKTEQLRLESLSHHWSFRSVTIHYDYDSPYRERQNGQTEIKRVWLPPRALQLLFERLNSVRAKLGLDADVDEPSWRSDNPV